MKMIKTKIVNKNNKYKVLVADDFGKYKTAASFDDKIDAQHYRKNLVDNTEKALKSQSKITVAEAYKSYVIYKFELYNTYNSLSEHQAKVYKGRYENWVSKYFPKNIELRKLNSEHLKKFFLTCRFKGLPYKSAVSLIYTFKGMFEWSIDQNYVLAVDYNIKYFQISKYPELKPQDGSDKVKKTTMINRFEVKQLYNAIKPTDPNDYYQVVNFVCINIFMYTGARPGEVRGIEWKNVNLKTKKIYITQQMHDQMLVPRVKALGSERIIHIAPHLLKVLSRWKDYQADRVPNPKFVLENVLTKLPIPDQQMRFFLYRAYAKIGLAIIDDDGNKVKVISCKFKGEPFKTFRHFAATALLNAQASNPLLNDNFIKSQLGHRDIKTTRMIYGDHNDLDSQSNIEEQIDNSLDNALNLKFN